MKVLFSWAYKEEGASLCIAGLSFDQPYFGV